MPPLYGEGAAAFERLQEEIIKRNLDLDVSLFAWQPSEHELQNASPTEIPKFAPEPAAFARINISMLESSEIPNAVSAFLGVLRLRTDQGNAAIMGFSRYVEP